MVALVRRLPLGGFEINGKVLVFLRCIRQGTPGAGENDLDAGLLGGSLLNHPQAFSGYLMG